MIGILLFIVASFLLYVLSIPMVLGALILDFKNVGKYFYDLAFAIDQLGNVLCAPVFNVIMIKSTKYKAFGNPDETISHVLGVNYINDNLTWLGKLLSNILNKIDKNHVQKAEKNEQ
jgi:hypothetical protein